MASDNNANLSRIKWCGFQKKIVTEIIGHMNESTRYLGLGGDYYMDADLGPDYMTMANGITSVFRAP